ncbi:hypothetical protein H310_01045 [Aphanomyces invadans]|uniref:Topoisomerase 6 subunit A/Spo11 TOPRIM domain-containing protein n=1 Tax=Aphanomyces invadans TaxID=157072 RepID=A0A024US79_9STRA|nr:hypothetical protein H310_01045 [Aphanomyces invadans]ETW08468.1 hypothetical protein H310_01045 [Aphanomyces invadans]|eukprot:XP_008862273.1 hypothetical protein H310_01045 [Aphanomyces invadans]
MGVGGKAIPPYIDRLTNLSSDAKFILLVEKDAAFMRLAEDRFYNKYPCIIRTAKGQPDVATRSFSSKSTILAVPSHHARSFLSPWHVRLKILSVYMSGSKKLSYDLASLTCRDMKWLGARPPDVTKYKIPDQCRLPMKDSDTKAGMDLLDEEFMKYAPLWSKYLTKEYLPRKLRDGSDWILQSVDTFPFY